jgi:hypothetical protein
MPPRGIDQDEVSRHHTPGARPLDTEAGVDLSDAPALTCLTSDFRVFDWQEAHRQNRNESANREDPVSGDRLRGMQHQWTDWDIR